MFVALGTAPTAETTVVAGPFRERGKALVAAERMTRLGYITEVAECQPVDQLEELGPLDWSDT